MSNYKQIILDALKNVVLEPHYKEVHDMHEVALCHRLAVHLEKSGKFTGYSIDCDYNRDERKIKRRRQITKNPKGKKFRPDIIVHKRGSGENNNLIMIEAKKDPCRPEERAEEIERLIDNANKYQYAHAFFVVFPKDNVKDDSVIEVKLEH